MAQNPVIVDGLQERFSDQSTEPTEVWFLESELCQCVMSNMSDEMSYQPDQCSFNIEESNRTSHRPSFQSGQS